MKVKDYLVCSLTFINFKLVLKINKYFRARFISVLLFFFVKEDCWFPLILMLERKLYSSAFLGLSFPNTGPQISLRRTILFESHIRLVLFGAG